MSLLTHLSTLVDALSRRLPLRPALCSGRGSEQHFLCTPGWHTVALLQKPLKTLTASSPTVSLAVVASGGTCYSGPHLSCLHESLPRLKPSLMSLASSNELRLIFCPVKGCLSTLAHGWFCSRQLETVWSPKIPVSFCSCIHLSLVRFGDWIILLCFLSARMFNISLTFPFQGQEILITCQNCPPSGGVKA